MCQVNVLQAKTELSRLLQMLESGDEDEIVIARNGTPVAKLELVKEKPISARIGAAAGAFVCTDEWEQAFADADLETAKLFGV
jgi:antitoxin (DNA-binding transcriptional repressor) of toxin-antitoxin stability system